jgi:TetR/AcrR family transcriptional repressor of nem operon
MSGDGKYRLTCIDDRSISFSGHRRREDAMKRDQQTAILEAGARLIHRQGFHNTGLKDILSAAGVPKGSFYFYFKSKEDFGLALIDHFTRIIGDRTRLILDDESLSPLERLRRLFATARQRHESEAFFGGCPIGNLAQELSDLSPAMRERLGRTLAGMAARFAALLRQAAEKGEIASGLDPDLLAGFLLDAWEGALLRMKVERSAKPLERFEEVLFSGLLA